ncbi:MBL fold metallo-hydrolase [Nioella sp.]|uniref:MBL fold metallo-hydrolase n=1 Tax=Nioella sp. TaxID=1912091 RepID=UPI003A87947E
MTATLLEPGLRRITAPNPSPMTLHGTNTFLVGERDIAVIDPGPAIDSHMHRILDALEPDQRISQILVTHSHLDHSPLAGPLSEVTGAPVLAAGPSDWGRSPVMQKLADAGGIGGGEGVDQDFTPDRVITDGEVIVGDGWQIEVLHTPGHMANHLSFAWTGALFSGDLVMGWSTSLISPPDGDLTAFRSSLTRLAARGDRLYYPAHGETVLDPALRCRDLLDHRAGREAQILAALQSGPATPAELTARIYADLDPRLVPVAERNVLAHLIDLVERNLTTPHPKLAISARFHAA